MRLTVPSENVFLASDIPSGLVMVTLASAILLPPELTVMFTCSFTIGISGVIVTLGVDLSETTSVLFMPQ